MSYQVLARKWRPRRFEEMVGQEHVLRALINALDKQRLHHAYLFTGTRGVGKTTIARILARSLNCEEGISSKPCGVCSACQQIGEGRFVDLIEVDAASRTKVDDTRELLDNVQYKPSVGRFKVYLIDEVHMLSTHSFNALLKTLEEPPPHVKFLLATTDPQKLPVTVLSRCLQFNLKRVPEDLIARHLADILGREQVPFDPGALQALAHGADGSIRDGMSLLDQAIAFGDGEVRLEATVAMLGTISREYLQQLVGLLAAGDATALMGGVENMAQFSPDYEVVVAGMISFFHELALAQLAPSVVESRVADATAILQLSAMIPAEDIQLWYEIALQGRRNISLSPTPRQGFEMLLLRMLAFRPAGAVPAAANPVAPARGKAEKKTELNALPASAAAAPTTTPAARLAVVVPPAPLVSNVMPLTRPPAVEPPRTSIQPQAPQPPDKPSRPAAPEAPPVYSEIEPPPADESAYAAVLADVAEASAPLVVASAATLQIRPADWEALLRSLSLQSRVRNFATNCTLVGSDGNVLNLAIAARHESLHSEAAEAMLAEALSQHFGSAVRLRLEMVADVSDSPAVQASRRAEQAQLAAEAAIESDPVVQQLRQTFSASVVQGSVEPILTPK